MAIDMRDNTLKTAPGLDRLRALIPDEARGPEFEVNEVVEIKGYNFRVTGLTDAYGGAITLIPHGPTDPNLKRVEALREAIQRREP